MDYRNLEHAKHDYENVFLKREKDLAGLIKRPLAEASILVLGCGYNYPDVILFSDRSKHVTGIDIVRTFYKDGLIHTLRDRIGEKTVLFKSLLRTVLERYRLKKYYYYLERISGVKIDHKRYSLLSYNGYEMPFKDETFDVVLSNAVLEHVENIRMVFKEIYRVTKSQGISWHLLHNYYSFSGGHVPKSLCLKHPWGHLRGKYQTQGLNKLTPNEINDCFSKYFEIIAMYQMDKNHRKKEIDDDFQFEGENHFSDNVREELHTFPVELLFTRAYLIIGKKKG
jgi:SAM-dependent methyltransferase